MISHFVFVKAIKEDFSAFERSHYSKVILKVLMRVFYEVSEANNCKRETETLKIDISYYYIIYTYVNII